MKLPERLMIYVEALRAWGLDLQLSMLAEECSELAIAALHTIRNRGSTYHGVSQSDLKLAEEIADVRIMIEQICFARELDEAVEENIKWKMGRLFERLPTEAKKRLEGASEK